MEFEQCSARTPREKNAAARASTAAFILFCGEHALHSGAQEALCAAVQDAPETVAAFELRRFPCEHPKYYDPATCEAEWVCTDSVLVRRSAFLAVGGLDEQVFESIADVDFSWRLRAAGWKLLYVPQAGVQCADEHAEGAAPQTAEEAQLALAEQATANLLLRLRFGTSEDLADWRRLCAEMAGNVATTPAMERRFVQRMAAVRRQQKAARAFYEKSVKNSAFTPRFLADFEPAFLRAGACYHTVLAQKTPEFTVVVRAYQRPAHLARTLDSLRWQTYRHFCVVVVEDGETPVCEAVCTAAGRVLPVRYHAMRSAAGRCETGNTGVRLAQTEYVCFLDDDDYFFAEHLETMAAAIEQHPACKLFFAGSLEAACEAGEALDVRRFWNNYKPGLTLADFFEENPASIQAVMFHKSLFAQCGGLDPALDALEDWDLWLRFALHTPFAVIPKTTSLYRVPAGADAYAARAAKFVQYRAAMQPRLAAYRAQLLERAAEQAQEEAAAQIAQQAATTVTEQPEPAPQASAANAVNTAAQASGSPTAAQAQAETQHLAALRAAAQAVSSAKGWRWAAPLRALTRGAKPALFGPDAPDFATADAATCNRFVFAARTSAFWRLLSRGR